jgi:lauroyl/myristoyl acyltransferase
MLARAVARVMPIGASYWIAEHVADIWYLASPQIRDNVAYNMGLVAGAPIGSEAIAIHTRRAMRNFARVVTEFLYLPRFNLETIGRLVDLTSFEDLKRRMAGRPTILVTAHLGNWELAAAAIAMSGVDLHVVVYDHPDRRVARLFRKHREAKGLKIMSVKEVFR